MFFAAASEALKLNISVAWWHWALLTAWFLALILFDILVVHRRDHKPTIRGAVIQSSVWIALGVGLGLVAWSAYGAEAGAQYFSGYLIEKSLSIDNVFAWSVILGYFAIPKQYHHRVLFWGVIGAIVMRTIFVFAGITVIERFEPVLILFGLILVWSGIKLFRTREEDEFRPDKSPLYRLALKFIPVSHKLDGHKLFTMEGGRRKATVLFMALLVVEFTDVVFAVDSVPAILAVSREPFIIIASNAAAILGMRALYFVFDLVRDKFWLLNHALGLLLLFVGIKLVLAPHQVFGIEWFNFHMPTYLSLLIITALIAIGMVGSLIIPRRKKS